MKVLVACEFSGIVREAFRNKGHDAFSCDIIDSEIPSKYHLKGHIIKYLNSGWDLMIAFPPCRYLAVSGARWFKGRELNQLKALSLVELLLNAPIPHIALENPVGVISSKVRKPDQIIQPWQFGEDASKKTCLWLKNLPKLKPTKIINKDRYSNQTPSGQNNLGPSKTRAQDRSRTYEGIAEAMASQWTFEGECKN